MCAVSMWSSDQLNKRTGPHIHMLAIIMEPGHVFRQICWVSASNTCYACLPQVSRDIAAGLAYLHPGVIHRDLKVSVIPLDQELASLLCIETNIARLQGILKKHAYLRT